MTEQKEYPKEVVQAILTRAEYAITNARIQGRLSWNGDKVAYESRDGVKNLLDIERIPDVFLDITATRFFVNDLVGNIHDELKNIFIKVLDTPIKKLNAGKLEKESNAKLDTLRQFSKEQDGKDKK
jgi:hypothetical protein